MNTNPDTTITPLRELRLYIQEFLARCDVKRWYHAKFHVSVCQDILVDAEKEQAEIAVRSHQAEAADLSAESEVTAARMALELAMSDGVSASDGPTIRKCIDRLKTAQRQCKLSAALDRSICEHTRQDLAEAVEAAQEKL